MCEIDLGNLRFECTVLKADNQNTQKRGKYRNFVQLTYFPNQIFKNMGYSNYKKIKQVTKKFGLKARLMPLFADVKPVQPSAWLVTSLEIAYKAPATTEKAKSERLVSPTLMEIVQAFEHKITLFSGEEMNVNPSDAVCGPSA